MENTPNDSTNTEPTEETPVKRKRGRPKKGQVKRVYNSETGFYSELPTEKLSKNAPLQDVIKHVNKATQALNVVAINQHKVHQFYADIRRRTEIDLVQVVVEARKGMTKSAIARLLGFSPNKFSERKDLEEAFEIGRAELQSEVLERALELMRTTKGPILPIFLSKNFADLKDTPDTQVNVQVNIGEESKTKLADKFLVKSADVARLNTVIVDTPVPVIEAEFEEVTANPKNTEK